MRLLLILPVFIVIISCRNNTKQPPKNILQPEKMQQILWDMFRADIFIRDYVRDSIKEVERVSLYKQILDLYQTNKEEFKESFTWYRSHPGILKPILDSLGKKGKDSTNVATPEVLDTVKRFRPFIRDDSNRAQ
jgi:hypothetical protein